MFEERRVSRQESAAGRDKGLRATEGPEARRKQNKRKREEEDVKVEREEEKKKRKSREKEPRPATPVSERGQLSVQGEG